MERCIFRDEDEDEDADGYIRKVFSGANEKIVIMCKAVYRGHLLGYGTDDTGFLVWPASSVLANFLVNNRHILKGASVLEVGSGAGLTGLFAARFCQQMVLTDGNDAVLELLKKNVSLNQFPGSKWGSHTTDDHAPRVERLIWGVPPHEQLSFAGPYDVVLGSDVIYPEGHDAMPLLLQTVKALLGCRGLFLTSYVPRSATTTELLLKTAMEVGFKVEEVPWCQYSVTPPPLGTVVYKMILGEPGLLLQAHTHKQKHG